MKKVMAFILAGLMILPMSTGYAATNADDAASLLYQYGFIEGDSGDLMVDQPLTRAQASVLLAEMYGKKNDAKAYIKTTGFPDVSTSDWFAPYVAFAKSNGWISGFPDGSFKPNEAVTKEQWASMLLNVLNYDYAWETVVQDINTLGVDFKAANVNALKRGEAFDGMWQALLLPEKGQQASLGYVLGKIPEDIANGGTSEVGEPYITDHYTKGLSEFYFVFSQDLDTGYTLDPKSYKIVQAGNLFLKVNNAEYQEDKNILKVKTNLPVIENEPISLTFGELIFADGSRLKGKEVSGLTFIDEDRPQVLEAVAIGDHHVLVTFSEPIMNDEVLNPMRDADNVRELEPSDFSIDSGNTGVFKATLFNNDTQAIIQTYGTIKDSVLIYFKNTIQDYAGNTMTGKAVSAKRLDDKEKPHITEIKEITPTSLKLVWNEPIQIVDSSVTNFYHTNGQEVIDSSLKVDDIDGNVMTLSFKQNPIMVGKTYLYIEPQSIKDYVGNMCEFLMIPFELPSENIPPEVLLPIKVVSEDEIEITFSEPIQNENNFLKKLSNYQLWDGAGNDLDELIEYATYSASENTLKIHFTQPLKGAYKLAVNGIKDYFDNALKNNVIDLNIEDLTPPDPSDWTAKVFYTSLYEQNVVVTYDEPMMMSGKYNVLDYSNYIINGKSLDQFNIEQVQIKKVDDRTVQITIATARNGGFDVVADTDNLAEDDDIIVARVADTRGNYTTSFANKLDLMDKSYVSVTDFRYIGNQTFRIYLSQALNTYDMADFIIDDTYKQFTITSYDVFKDGDKTVVEVTVQDDVDDLSHTMLSAKGQRSRTIFGETLNPSGAKIKASEHVPAEIVQSRINGYMVDDVRLDDNLGAITIKLTKDINANSLSLYTFTVNNADVKKVVAGTKAVIIYIESKDIDDMRVGTTITQAYPMIDSSGIEVTGIKTQIQEIR